MIELDGGGHYEWAQYEYDRKRDFYLQLPSSLFQHRNAVFRLKFRLLLITLKYRLPWLPSLYRAPLNLFTAISKPFMRS